MNKTRGSLALAARLVLASQAVAQPHGGGPGMMGGHGSAACAGLKRSAEQLRR